MKKYRSHKVVEAGKIVKFEVCDDHYLFWVDGQEKPIVVPADIFCRWKGPVVGSFLVRYQPDGYMALSPAKAFEDGYSKVEELAFENKGHDYGDHPLDGQEEASPLASGYIPPGYFIPDRRPSDPGGWPKDTSELNKENIQKAIDIAIQYGGFDGSHHKDWVIDQMVRALAGDRYDTIVKDACAGEIGEGACDWDCGIAP